MRLLSAYRSWQGFSGLAATVAVPAPGAGRWHRWHLLIEAREMTDVCQASSVSCCSAQQDLDMLIEIYQFMLAWNHRQADESAGVRDRCAFQSSLPTILPAERVAAATGLWREKIASWSASRERCFVQKRCAPPESRAARTGTTEGQVSRQIDPRFSEHPTIRRERSRKSQ
jgi:hypothetical protein